MRHELFVTNKLNGKTIANITTITLNNITIMNTLRIFVISFILFLPVFSGCRQQRPEGMPATVPCQITVLKNGVPLAGIDVSLHLPEGNGTLSFMALTNAQGIARIQTHSVSYKESGVPVGNYKVTIDKPVQLPPDGVDDSKLSGKELNDYLTKREAELEKIRIVPKWLTVSTSTPLEIKAEAPTGGELTIDLKDFPDKP
ncbi:MAG: carboxypeptidase-like regulatory domain-containing protein [Planctomycetaceae bacterium]|nr:carboxypeptidase-like regulatory domain-containing protein [Planctomycetaceae bacterium]